MLLAVALLIANIIALRAFVAKSNWDANFATFAPIAILAIAATPAVMTGSGGLDLSIAPSANLVNVVLVTDLLPHPILSSPWIAIPLMLAMSAGIGLINGLAVTIMRVPPVVATVGMLLLLTGLVTQIAPLPTTVTAGWMNDLHGDLAGVPWGLILIAIPLAIWGLLRRTPLISSLYLVGGHAPSAYSAGINVTAVRITAYTLGGLFAGIGGIAITATILTSDTTIGLTYALIAMAAVALGGTPVGIGGRGGVLGSLCGAATIYLLQNFLILINVNSNLMQVAYGVLLIVGAVLGGLLARAPKVRPVKLGVSQ
jgi:ribose transport system permease protein